MDISKVIEKWTQNKLMEEGFSKREIQGIMERNELEIKDISESVIHLLEEMMENIIDGSDN